MIEILPGELQALLEEVTPKAWRPNARGMVFFGNTSEETKAVVQAARKWAADDGFPIRIPHHSVSPAGLAKSPRSELDLAIGGILLLQDISDFDDHGLHNLAKRIEREHLPVVVIGVDTPAPRADSMAFRRRLGEQSSVIGLPIVIIDDFGSVATPPPTSDVEVALAAINRHRAAIGMHPLDPVSSGWTGDDVLLEADRVARLPNPLLDLKRRVLL